jgi:hypothetical protein
MTSRQNHLGSAKCWAATAALAALVTIPWALPVPAHGQDQPKEYGIAAKRPVLQASCRHCPWGALGDILKTIMAPAYDVAICYGCSGENGARYVSKRLMSAEISDRLFAQGVATRRSISESRNRNMSAGPTKAVMVIRKMGLSATCG